MTAGEPHSQEVLLYLHGWGGSKELWQRTLSDLGDFAYGVALDLPGTGQTPENPTFTTMAEFASWIAQVCQTMSLDSVTLVGHSLGGNLAAQVALDFPLLVRRLVLVDAALQPQYLPYGSAWPLSPLFGRAALWLSRCSSWPLAIQGRCVPHQHGGGEWRPFLRRRYLDLTCNSNQALQQQLRALVGNSILFDRLAELTQPILIIHGVKDAMVPVKCAYTAAQAIPAAELRLFPQARHCPMDSDPPAFTAALRQFCEAHP